MEKRAQFLHYMYGKWSEELYLHDFPNLHLISKLHLPYVH